MLLLQLQLLLLLDADVLIEGQLSYSTAILQILMNLLQ